MKPSETLVRLRRRIEAAPRLAEENRTRMLELVTELEKEIGELPDQVVEDHVHSALTLTDAMVMESNREKENQDVFHRVQGAVSEMSRELELKYPRIAHALMGIARAFN